MNEIHQISLKLRLGMHPDRAIKPGELRRLWDERCKDVLKRRINRHRRAHHAIGSQGECSNGAQTGQESHVFGTAHSNN